jgi:hypothetical protein
LTVAYSIRVISRKHIEISPRAALPNRPSLPFSPLSLSRRPRPSSPLPRCLAGTRPAARPSPSWARSTTALPRPSPHSPAMACLPSDPEASVGPRPRTTATRRPSTSPQTSRHSQVRQCYHIVCSPRLYGRLRD